MNNTPFVAPIAISICITTKNRPEFLKETLKSILAQTYINYEVIVWCNDLLFPEQPVMYERIAYHSNGYDLGMVGGFNKALSLATGDYVLMLSDDDLLYADALETLVKLQESYQGYGAYFGGCDILHEHPSIASMMLHKVGNNSTLRNKELGNVDIYLSKAFAPTFFSGRLNTYLFWSAGIVKREIALKVGAFPDYGTPLMGDFIYTVGCCNEEGCVLVNKPVMRQRVHKLNHGRIGDCKDLFRVRKAFRDKCYTKFSPSYKLEALINTFTRNWIVNHCIFLQQYFDKYEITNELATFMAQELTYIEFLKVQCGVLYIGFMNWLRRKISK